MTNEEVNDILQVFKTLDIPCCLKKHISNELVDRLEFNLLSLKDFVKVKKVVELIRICLHKDIKQVESTQYHFALELRKEGKLFDMVEYNKKYDINDKYSALIGIDNSDNPIYFNLKKSIHTLIGGSTGMGKTSIINNIIYSLTRKNTPQELEIYIIDVKRTLANWNDLPHLKKNAIFDATDAYFALDNISSIIKERNAILAERKASKADDDTFPHILVIIDELADLMLSNIHKDIEEQITRISQLERSVNVNLIVATQNPIGKVCTSNVKANCPTRIALKTLSNVNSRVILDDTKPDASKLDGVGYAIMRCAGDTTTQTFKACYLSDEQIKDYLKGEK